MVNADDEEMRVDDSVVPDERVSSGGRVRALPWPTGCPPRSRFCSLLRLLVDLFGAMCIGTHLAGRRRPAA